MKFTKMHGLGNDYVYVNGFTETVADAPSLARAISDRHRGVGSDGLILIQPSSVAAVRMEMYNADGSRAQMCGNGIRCVAKYAIDHELARSDPSVPETMMQAAGDRPFDGGLTVETDAGVLQLGIILTDGKVDRVCVDMGEPSLHPKDLPMRIETDPVVDVEVSIGERRYRMTGVSVGNPHVAIFVENLDAVNLVGEGTAIETSPIFPERINVHFVQVNDPSDVTVLTWERGSGATQACGTGATAVCVAGVATERTGRTITAHLPGGPLRLHWAENNHVFMTGPATEVFQGEWNGHSG